MKIKVRHHKSEGLFFIIAGLFGILIYLWFGDFILRTFSVILGISLIFQGLTSMLYCMAMEKRGRIWWFMLIQSIITFGAGITLFLPAGLSVIGSIVGGIILIFGIMNIIIAPDKKSQFRRDFFKYLLGILLICSSTAVLLSIFIYVCLGFIILFGLYLLLFSKDKEIHFPTFHEEQRIDTDYVDAQYDVVDDDKDDKQQ